MNDLVERAKREFGVTDDWLKAGFILPDGSLLDLGEGAKPGASRIPHNDVAKVFTDDERSLHYHSEMCFVLLTGAMRICYIVNPDGTYELDVEASIIHPPTEAQLRTLTQISRDCERFYYDLINANGAIVNPPNPNSERVSVRDFMVDFRVSQEGIKTLNLRSGQPLPTRIR